jgi:hypothetical protein
MHLPHISDRRIQRFPFLAIHMFRIMYTDLHHHISIYLGCIIMNKAPEPLVTVDETRKVVPYLE